MLVRLLLLLLLLEMVVAVPLVVVVPARLTLVRLRSTNGLPGNASRSGWPPVPSSARSVSLRELRDCAGGRLPRRSLSGSTIPFLAPTSPGGPWGTRLVRPGQLIPRSRGARGCRGPGQNHCRLRCWGPLRQGCLVQGRTCWPATMMRWSECFGGTGQSGLPLQNWTAPGRRRSSGSRISRLWRQMRQLGSRPGQAARSMGGAVSQGRQLGRRPQRLLAAARARVAARAAAGAPPPVQVPVPARRQRQASGRLGRPLRLLLPQRRDLARRGGGRGGAQRLALLAPERGVRGRLGGP